MKSDSELVNAVLKGQKQAFAVLVRRYDRPVRAIALNVVGDYHAASDVTQDALVKAYEKLPSLRKPQSFGAWLMKITRRCALDYVRRKPNTLSLESAAAGIIEKPDGQLDEEKQRLLAAVAKLPENEKQVIMLHYFSGHNVREAAEIIGKNVGTVTKQLSRARKRLRKILKES